MTTPMKKTITRHLMALTAFGLLPVHILAVCRIGYTPSDTTRTITPLFEPIVIEDSIPTTFPDADITTVDIPTPAEPQRSGITCKVGTPATDATVSPLGAAQWNLAFDVPPGVGGMNPQVGLTYSSQSSNGNAGWGISISGISCITRGMKTYYFDGVPRGIKHDTGDALFLDGRRLLRYSGTEGSSNSIYYPEGDPYTTVKVTSSNATGPLSFEVTSPDGMKTLFGSVANARLTFTDTVGVQRVHSWYVSRQEDARGNYITYSYLHDQLTVYPQTITYGKNTQTGTGAENYIRFTYTGVYAPTLRSFVIGGQRGYVAKCLESVRTMTGTAVFREYLLNYDPFSDGSTKKFERLTSVTCKNGAGEQMKPVTLTWNTMPGSNQQTTTTSYNWTCAHPDYSVEDSLFLAADMDGNGLADIIRISKERNNGTDYNYAYIHYASKGNDGVIAYGSPVIAYIGSNNEESHFVRTKIANLISDTDGDGLSDLVIPYYFDNSETRSVLFTIARGKALREGTTYFLNSCSAPLMTASRQMAFLTGDLNNDGREDILFLEDMKSNGRNYLHVQLSTGTSFTHVQTPLEGLGNGIRPFLGDFNGDGLTDLMVFDDDGYRIYWHTGNVNMPFAESSNTIVSTDMSSKWRMEQGDFNGDGLVDIVYEEKESPNYYFALNNGDGTFTEHLALDHYTIFDQTTDNDDVSLSLLPMDIDRDGMTDLVVAKAKYNHHGGIFPHDSFSRTMVGWLLSDGTTLTEIKQVDSYGLEDEAKGHNIMIADFDGDGWPELANNGGDWYTNVQATQDGCHIHIYHPTGFTPSTGKLAMATDGLGAATSFTYGTTADTRLYTHEYTGDFPLSNAHASLAVVSTMAKDDGLTGTHTTTYRYRGFKLHMQGKGPLGFMDIAARDDRTGVTTQNGTAQWHATHYIPVVVYSVTSMGYDKDSTSTNMDVINYSKSRYISYPSSKRTLDMDGNVTTATYTYNASYGYPLSELLQYDGSGMYRKTEYSNYVKKGGKWLPQTVKKTQKHAHDAGEYSTTTKYTYNSAGDPLTVIERYGSPTQLTTTLTRDSYGNVLSTTQAGQGITPVTSYTVYDATGRFPVRRYQSVDSGENTWTYDTWGNVLTATDATEASNPLTTVHTLDGWGDDTAVTSPEGVTTAITSGWGSGATAAWWVMEETPGRAPVKTWYDVRGRVSETQTKGHCNMDVVRTYTLNAWGREQQVVTRTGTRAVIEMNTFDCRGRATWHFRTGEGGTTYSYGNRSRTATHGGRTYTTTYDAWGNPLESTDPATAVTYTYGSNGLPAEVEADGATVAMEYDDAGNRTRLDDPDAGETLSTYTADGRLLTRTDGRGIQTVNTYDGMGRLTQSVCDTLTTLYTYGTTGHDKMRLKKVETNGMSEEYTYDAYGRVVFHKRDYGDGMMSGHTFTYDSLGHVARHRFPSGLDVDYTYDGNGFMLTMACNGTQVWGDLTDDGWTATDGFGNTTTTTMRNQAGRLTERYIQRHGQTAQLYRTAYAWDDVRGNLTSRTGIAGAAVTETFTYDALDRLTNVSQGSRQMLAMEYADNGNILSKTGLGDYSYDGAQPHAVTGVENEDYVIASSAQTVAYNPWGKVSGMEDRRPA